MNIKEILQDNKNIEILKLLQRNPRMSIAELARKIRMSNPATKERVRRLEKSGVIAGYRVELDPKAAGHEITAFVRIRPLPGHLPKISALAQQVPEVGLTVSEASKTRNMTPSQTHLALLITPPCLSGLAAFTMFA